MCICKCLMRSHLSEKALSQWLHVYGFSPVCVLIWVIRLILLASLVRLVSLVRFFSSVFSHKCFKIRFRIEIFVTMVALVCSLPIVFPYMGYKVLTMWKKPCHIGYIGMVSLHYVYLYGLKGVDYMWMLQHTGCTDKVSP